MIGLVVVGHSHALATAAVALASEMVAEADRPPIEVAAGLDETTFGTDAAAVAEAIGRADEAGGGEGVLVLLDLGSAVLSAEMAVEFLDPDLAERVRLSDAPLVEGLVAATVTASTGAGLDQVAAEARAGLVAKSMHLGDAGASDSPDAGAPDAGHPDAQHDPDSVSAELVVTGAHGLHARPAARIVGCVTGFAQAQVRVRNLDSGRGPVDARSLTALATLDARQGHRLEVTATGPQADQVLAALAELAGSAFGDDEPAGAAPAARSAPATQARRGSGLEAALGPSRRAGAPVDLSGYRPGDPEQERQRLEAAIAEATAQVGQLQEQTRERIGAAEADIFTAHQVLLADPELTAPVLAAVADGIPAPQAWRDRVDTLQGQFQELSEAYQRDRAQDVRSVGQRVLRLLVGAVEEESAGDEPGILVVDELDPARAAALDPEVDTAVVTVRGGATGHGVLLARARGIPVLTGAGARAEVSDGTLLALDVRSGRLEVAPGPEVVAEFEALLEQRATERRRAEEHAAEPARTTDGHTIRVKANIGSLADAAQALALGADGSGLVRTEMLFGSYAEAPSVSEQVDSYTVVAEALRGRPVTVRTWDIGGDKPLAFLDQPSEANPFLGVRGLRSFRRDPAMLVDQLEAVCRVAHRHPIRVMFPMVSTVEEVDWALARLDEAAGRLAGGRPDTLEVGIMVEVPAAALRPEALTAVLDFVSIGSNDLTQYVMAADRGNAGVAELADHADPAVLRLIRAVCDGVAEGVQVCVCGEAASDPALARLLVGLGVHELSAAATAVPVVKAAIRDSSMADLRDLADRSLHCDSAAEVHELLASHA